MWSQVPIAAVLSLVGVLLGAGLQYYFGRTLEGRKQLALQRGQAYVDYFKAVALAAQQGRSKNSLAVSERDVLAQVANAKVRVCIYGSSTVIKHLSEFEAIGAVINSAASETIIVNLLRAMRQDTGMGDGGVSQKDYHNIILGPEFKPDS